MNTIQINHPQFNHGKLTLTEYEFLKNEVAKTQMEHPGAGYEDWRLGQSWFNELVAHLPQFEWIRGTNLDPFYRDEVLLDLFFHILDEEAYASWTHSDEYKRLHSKFVKDHEATPVDTSGSELSDFVEGEDNYDPHNNNITASYMLPDDYVKAIEDSLREDVERYVRESEEAKRKDEDNEKAINEKMRIFNIPNDGFYKIQLKGSAYDSFMRLYRYTDVYGVVQYADHPQVMCTASQLVATIWAEDNDAVWLWQKHFSRSEHPWQLVWSNPNNPTEVIEIPDSSKEIPEEWAEEDAVFESEYIKAKDLIMNNAQVNIVHENEHTPMITNSSTSDTTVTLKPGASIGYAAHDTFLGNPVGTIPGLAYSGNYEPTPKETTNVRLNITTTRTPLECVELLKQISEMLGTLEDVRVRNLEISQW